MTNPLYQYPMFPSFFLTEWSKGKKTVGVESDPGMNPDFTWDSLSQDHFASLTLSLFISKKGTMITISQDCWEGLRERRQRAQCESRTLQGLYSFIVLNNILMLLNDRQHANHW